MFWYFYLSKGPEYIFSPPSFLTSYSCPLSSSSFFSCISQPLSFSWTEVLSEATHISKHALGSKWDATLLSLLSRKQSRLLSLMLRCPASSSRQSTEDGTELTIMQWQRRQFSSHGHISAWHTLWSREGRHKQRTCTPTHAHTNHKRDVFLPPMRWYVCVCVLCVCYSQRTPLDCHRQMIGKIEAISLLRRGLVWRQNRSRSYGLLGRQRDGVMLSVVTKCCSWRLGKVFLCNPNIHFKQDLLFPFLKKKKNIKLNRR